MDNLQSSINLLNIYDLEKELKGKTIKYSGYGLLFCFGCSFVSKIIMAKTRQFEKEIVPSHVAIVYGQFIFESTTDSVIINNKTIPKGVRMWLISDYIKAEKERLTKYYFYKMKPTAFDTDQLLQNLHLPYGVDSIVDFILKDKSNGDRTNGLICSQYANKCTKLSKQRCPSPADLFRIVKDLEDDNNNANI